jgi:hypothetical protein
MNNASLYSHNINGCLFRRAIDQEIDGRLISHFLFSAHVSLNEEEPSGR